MDITRRHHLQALKHAAQHLREHHMSIAQAAKAAIPPLLDTTVSTTTPAG